MNYEKLQDRPVAERLKEMETIMSTGYPQPVFNSDGSVEFVNSPEEALAVMGGVNRQKSDFGGPTKKG